MSETTFEQVTEAYTDARMALAANAKFEIEFAARMMEQHGNDANMAATLLARIIQHTKNDRADMESARQAFIDWE